MNNRNPMEMPHLLVEDFRFVTEDFAGDGNPFRTISDPVVVNAAASAMESKLEQSVLRLHNKVNTKLIYYPYMGDQLFGGHRFVADECHIRGYITLTDEGEIEFWRDRMRKSVEVLVSHMRTKERTKLVAVQVPFDADMVFDSDFSAGFFSPITNCVIGGIFQESANCTGAAPDPITCPACLSSELGDSHTEQTGCEERLMSNPNPFVNEVLRRFDIRAGQLTLLQGAFSKFFADLRNEPVAEKAGESILKTFLSEEFDHEAWAVAKGLVSKQAEHSILCMSELMQSAHSILRKEQRMLLPYLSKIVMESVGFGSGEKKPEGDEGDEDEDGDDEGGGAEPTIQ